MSTVVVPHTFPYITAAILSTAFVLIGQAAVVAKTRRVAGIKYPQLYAEKAEAEASKDAYRFNCAQRAHQNTLEYFPIILTTTLVTSLKFPILAAAACGLWSFSRIAYTRGYTTGDPAKRHSIVSRLAYPALIGLLGGSVWAVVDLIWAGI
jgi:glutathione S-transferase